MAVSAEFPPGTAALIVAHGSRRAEANDDLAELAHRLREATGLAIVEIGYLELATPTIPDGARLCVEQGAMRVLIVPYFLSAGRHVTADLETLRREFARDYPGVEFRLCPPLGLHPLMVEIVQDRLAEGLRDQ